MNKFIGHYERFGDVYVNLHEMKSCEIKEATVSTIFDSQKIWPEPGEGDTFDCCAAEGRGSCLCITEIFGTVAEAETCVTERLQKASL